MLSPRNIVVNGENLISVGMRLDKPIEQALLYFKKCLEDSNIERSALFRILCLNESESGQILLEYYVNPIIKIEILYQQYGINFNLTRNSAANILIVDGIKPTSSSDYSANFKIRVRTLVRPMYEAWKQNPKLNNRLRNILINIEVCKKSLREQMMDSEIEQMMDSEIEQMINNKIEQMMDSEIERIMTNHRSKSVGLIFEKLIISVFSEERLTMLNTDIDFAKVLKKWLKSEFPAKTLDNPTV
jgi:hypothetical protein